ncbi:MAG: dCMP deaminase family protein [Candidatus Peribacteraceae bacterium]|nr:dCMP deaminase family protein [Candidatus Peribacteraceae bacterium]
MVKEQESKSPRKQSDHKKIEPFADPELVIGLVGAVGTELDKVVKIITEKLKTFRYKNIREIHISKEVIPEVTNVDLLENGDEYLRINNLMTAGDEARRKSGDNSILALGAAARIGEQAVKVGNTTPRSYRKGQAYIIKSLKHPDEVLKLREIYPLGFYLFGVYAEEGQRKNYLINDKGMEKEDAIKLMGRDEGENTDYGQRVRDTFHMSDFFVHLDDSQDKLKNSLWRILDIMFGHPQETPIFDEYAMFLAHAAALRSGSLSRQVGAVIAKNNEIIATGANECPKYGGGLYWPYFNNKKHKIENDEDGRDFMRDEDSNHVQLERIKDDILAKADLSGDNVEKLKKALDSSPINDLSEFGRTVHAEMEALMQCARNQGNARGSTLYTTLFSCHNCAKHMIAAGIKRVVYIEPYPKSKATELHGDAILLGFFKPKESPGKMCFEPFVGVGPRRFFDLFSMWLGSGSKLIRKNPEKKPLKWEPKKSKLRLQMLPHSYLDAELTASDAFQNVAKRSKEAKK